MYHCKRQALYYTHILFEDQALKPAINQQKMKRSSMPSQPKPSFICFCISFVFCCNTRVLHAYKEEGKCDN